MLKQIKYNKDRVEALLSKYPACRDCDKKLWLAYLVQYHNLNKVLRVADDPYAAFRDLVLSSSMPPMESVRRIRQKIQEGGKYLGTKRLEKLEESELVRDWARSSK